MIIQIWEEDKKNILKFKGSLITLGINCIMQEDIYIVSIVIVYKSSIYSLLVNFYDPPK